MDSRRQAAKTFRDLIVWQKAHELVLAIYQKTQAFPKDEVYALSSQIRRSSMSVAANIAEGFKKTSARDKARIYNIAQGSLSETEYFLLLSQDLKYVDMKEFILKADEVGRILGSYIKAVKG